MLDVCEQAVDERMNREDGDDEPFEKVRNVVVAAQVYAFVGECHP